MSELRVGFLFLGNWLIMMIVILDPDVFLKGGQIFVDELVRWVR